MCRMLIACPNKDRPLGFSIMKSCSILISLGKNADFIDSKGVGRVCKALEKCQAILGVYKQTKIYCIATAIFRSATNAREVLKHINDKFGLVFRICDPGEEIMFSACGCRDVMIHQWSFVMDMGGGSTEIGLFEKNTNNLEMFKWISLPYGLFYFGELKDNQKPIPTDAYKALQNFISLTEIRPSKASMIICRSGIMTVLATYLCRKNNLGKVAVYGQVFEVSHIIESINTILKMSDTDIINQRLLSNPMHIASTRGTMGFTRDILSKLPIKFVILGNGGVKEGMMSLACELK